MRLFLANKGYGNRSNATVPAAKFGVAARLAAVHALEHRPVRAALSVHQTHSVRAASGKARPSSLSISENVRTTVEA